MTEVTIAICDLCRMDGEENIKAIGWYEADDGEHYDVCLKHAKDVKNAGKKVYYIKDVY